jgi:hypothetical protein
MCDMQRQQICIEVLNPLSRYRDVAEECSIARNVL